MQIGLHIIITNKNSAGNIRSQPEIFLRNNPFVPVFILCDLLLVVFSIITFFPFCRFIKPSNGRIYSIMFQSVCTQALFYFVSFFALLRHAFFTCFYFSTFAISIGELNPGFDTFYHKFNCIAFVFSKSTLNFKLKIIKTFPVRLF